MLKDGLRFIRLKSVMFVQPTAFNQCSHCTNLLQSISLAESQLIPKQVRLVQPLTCFILIRTVSDKFLVYLTRGFCKFTFKVDLCSSADFGCMSLLKSPQRNSLLQIGRFVITLILHRIGSMANRQHVPQMVTVLSF